MADAALDLSAEIERLAEAWARGERPRVEDILAAHPGLTDEQAVRLVYEEACLRREAGEVGASTEILRRFPQWRSKLALLFDCQRLFDLTPAVAFPNPGDDLGDFCLLAEIGRGAVGVTFLAAQRSLAGRPIVLKLAPVDPRHDEHLSLARLQHMHIAPLYFEQTFEDRGLRALVMPYLGGGSLARVLDALATVHVADRRGSDLLAALARCAPPGAPAVSDRGPIAPRLARASYVEAVAWLGAGLADALQYAHDRGLVHLDVKPSNILIAADGQPMLLDFHLAAESIPAGASHVERLGGTPGYAAPEQLAAMRAVARGEPVPHAVDGRADVHGLAVSLYEALGGDRPADPATPRRRLSRCNPRVSPGLSRLIARGLDPDPAKRYPSAASFAADLRRHLDALPLRGVRNHPLECWSKWRRRRPAALVRMGLTIVALALAAGAVGLAYNLDRQATVARRLQADNRAAELHALVDRLRFHVGIAPTPDAESAWLARQARDIWSHRDKLVAPETRADLVDLALLLADLQAPSDHARRRLFDEAEQTLGPCPELRRGRDAETPPVTAWDHYAAGRRLLQQGRAEAALDHGLAAIALQPGEFWPHFLRAACAYRLGRLDEALAALDVCIALAPRSAECYHNRAIVNEALGRIPQARADDAHALALDPLLAAAARHRDALPPGPPVASPPQ